MTSKYKWITLLSLCCLLLALCACGGSGTAGSAAPPEQAAESENAAEAASDGQTPEALTAEAPASAEQAGEEQTPEETEEHSKTVEEMLEEKNRPAEASVVAGGASYALKKNVESYLILGIDATKVPEYHSFDGTGQCDTILLLVVDNDAKKYSTLQINRDSMVEVEVLDFTGATTGVSQVQSILFAHSYGDGRESSCENVVRAVSRMLGGININGYASLRYACIPDLNDAVGGIYVKIEDDFSKDDPSFVIGETVELTGENVLTYVRGRMSVGDGTNVSRMRRQRTYLNAFEKRFKEELRGNSGIINTLYNLAKPYMVTNMSLGTITNVATKSLSYRNAGILTLRGTPRDVIYNNETYTEFDLDNGSITEAVLDLFYTKIS